MDRRGTAALKEYPVEGTQWKKYPTEERGECETMDRRGTSALKECPDSPDSIS